MQLLDMLAAVDGRVLLPLVGAYACWIGAKIIGSPK